LALEIAACIRARFGLRASRESYAASRPNMPTDVALETPRSFRRDFDLTPSGHSQEARSGNSTSNRE
jgi:hypothetical protein